MFSTPPIIKIGNLAEGEEKKFKVLLTKSVNKFKEDKDWVKMQVEYLPDYPKMLQIAESSKLYPSYPEQRHLIRWTVVEDYLAGRKYKKSTTLQLAGDEKDEPHYLKMSDEFADALESSKTTNIADKNKTSVLHTPNTKIKGNYKKSGNHNEINTSESKEDKRVTQYKKACHRGNGFACYDLAFAYETGSLVAKDIKKANQLYLLACVLDNNACLAIATYYEAQDNPKEAIYYFDKACETNAKVCSHLAELYEEGKYGLVKDLEKAKDYYTKACDLGDKDGCIKYKKMRSN